LQTVEKGIPFADRLRSLREAAGLSQYALAQRSGLSKQAVSQLEMGQSEPTWQTVQLLAAVLDVQCTAFLDPSIRPPAAQPARPRGRPRKDGDRAEQPPGASSSRKPAGRRAPRPRGE
jgi:transcriptional regulator with XRE-family HTH domain